MKANGKRTISAKKRIIIAYQTQDKAFQLILLFSLSPFSCFSLVNSCQDKRGNHACIKHEYFFV